MAACNTRAVDADACEWRSDSAAEGGREGERRAEREGEREVGKASGVQARQDREGKGNEVCGARRGSWAAAGSTDQAGEVVWCVLLGGWAASQHPHEQQTQITTPEVIFPEPQSLNPVP